jgi:hypothetical protein
MKNFTPVMAAILFIAFAIIAFWFGEAGIGIFQMEPYVVCAIGCIATAIVCSKRKVIRIFAGGVFISVYFFLFYVGNVSFYSVFGNCADEGEKVRSLIQEFYKKKGSYPNSLDQLNIQLPCQRYTRGSMLKYYPTELGYKLSFRDWLIEHSATESETFIAHK